MDNKSEIPSSSCEQPTTESNNPNDNTNLADIKETLITFDKPKESFDTSSETKEAKSEDLTSNSEDKDTTKIIDNLPIEKETNLITIKAEVPIVQPSQQNDLIDNKPLKDEFKELITTNDILEKESVVTTKVQTDEINSHSSTLNHIVQKEVQTPTIQQEIVKSNEKKKKEDEKLAIYKALAIKLKKELVKCRDDIVKLKDESQKQIISQKEKIESLEESLSTEKQSNATLEAQVKILKQQIDSTENDLQTLQNDFENYKIRASQIMNQNNPKLSNINQNFEDNLYKQMKQFSLDQQKRIDSLEAQLNLSLEKNKEIEQENKIYLEKLKYLDEHLNSMKNLNNKLELLTKENENLKSTLATFKQKFKKPNCDEPETNIKISNIDVINKKSDSNTATKNPSSFDGQELDETITETTRVSPSVSVKDHDSQTNSSSSYDGSTSGGYVHIKPTTFEIISRSSVLEDAQNQIDNLTKAYFDSESTNSLLSEQVVALKEEIRRLQRGTERMDLAENLEYLKNILFKFLTLDGGQMEQKQRLIPVLSTVLKLSPEETTKLYSTTVVDKPSMASSFFKL